MALQPWEAQKQFGTLAKEINAPVAVTVAPKPGSFQISWQRRPGKVDGFIILIGDSPGELRDHQRVPQNGNIMSYAAEVGSLSNGKVYYTTVVAFRGDDRSTIPEVWKVVPNLPGLHVPAEQVELTQTIHDQQVQPVGSEIIAQAQGRNNERERAQVHSEPPPNQQPTETVQEDRPVVVAICAICTGDVVYDGNLFMFVCTGCATRFVQRVRDGQFLPTNMLPNGICSCCEPRRPLIHPPEEQFRRCSLSGEQYVQLSEGELVRLSQLDYGICSCCQPPSALMLNNQGQVVCTRKRENLYVREGNQFVLRLPEAPPSLLSDIDRALANGSAGMMPNGILISGNGNEQQSDGRRRRR